MMCFRENINYIKLVPPFDGLAPSSTTGAGSAPAFGYEIASVHSSGRSNGGYYRDVPPRGQNLKFLLSFLEKLAK